MAKKKLQQKVKVLDYTSTLIHWQEYWPREYIVEQDKDGNCALFSRCTGNDQGHVLLAKRDQLIVVPSSKANQLDASLKNMGRGWCSEVYGHDPPRVA